MRPDPQVKALKALGDSTRIRTLAALTDRTLCVCQIVELFELSASTISKHLQILRDAGLVNSQKSGRWIYYSRSNSGDSGIPATALELIVDTVCKSDQGREDARRLQAIQKIDPETLCERQRMSPTPQKKRVKE